jgi:hypothetical protein
VNNDLVMSIQMLTEAHHVHKIRVFGIPHLLHHHTITLVHLLITIDADKDALGKALL